MDKILKHIDKWLSNFLVFLMTIMVLTVTWQVFSRFILQAPSSYTEELARFLLIWIGLLGSSYALRTKSHLGIDLITQKASRKRKDTVNIIVNAIIILFSFFVMVVGGLYLVDLTLSLNQISAALGIKMGYVYLVVPLSGTLMIFYSINFILEIVSGKTAEDQSRPIDKGAI